MSSTMDETSYWMWTRRKLGTRPLLTSSIARIAAGSSYKESWEEQAFAEDSAGLLGGCIWPPRSYTCSFCRREFRSAQALGGHMNVHRRDRARLKQSLSSASELSHDVSHHDQLMNPRAPIPMCVQHPQHLGGLIYNTYPNPNPNSGVSASSTQENCKEKFMDSPSCNFSSVIKEHKEESCLSIARPRVDSIPYPTIDVPELKLWREGLRIREVIRREKRSFREVDDDADEDRSSKRRWTDPTLELLRSEVLKLSPSPHEDLDLELRL